MVWLRDLLSDLVIDYSGRRSRVLLLLVAVALSTGSLVTAVGVSQMAASQIDADIAASGTDLLTVEIAPAAVDDASPDVVVEEAQRPGEGASAQIFLPEALERVRAIDGVRAAGLRLPMSDGIHVRRNADADESSTLGYDLGSPVDVFGATSGYLAAYHVTPEEAWMLDAVDPYDVALVGEGIAEELGIPVAAKELTGYRIYVDDHAYEVIGVVSSGPAAASGVVLPYRTALSTAGTDRDATLLVRTEPGASRPISEIVREAVLPARPDVLQVSAAIDLATLRTGVNEQLSRLAGAVGGLLLVLTVLLIANSMIVSVMARTAEIGLRRALGASSLDISVLFLADGGVIGALGGLAGSALGCAATVGIAIVNGWSAVLHPWYLVAGPVVGLLVGIVASAYPSVRAARISPAEAVRVE